MNKNYIAIAVVLTVFIAGCDKGKSQGGKPGGKPGADQVKRAKPVKTLNLQKQLITKTVITNSELEAKINIEHNSEIDATLEIVHVKNGDSINKGDIIAEFSSETITSNYKIAEASLKSAEANYNQALKFSEIQVRNDLVFAETSYITAEESLKRALRGTDNEELAQAQSSLKSSEENFQIAKTTYERYKNLYEKDLISELDFLQHENSYINAKSTLEESEKSIEILKRGYDVEEINKLQANLNNSKADYELMKNYVQEESWKYTIENTKASYDTAKANYQNAKADYDDLTLKAKVSGIVTDLDTKLYTNYKSGDLICNVVNDDVIEGEIEVSANDLASTNIGKNVTVYIEGLDKEYEAKITELYRTANPDTKKFPITVEFENDGKVREGMYAKMSLQTLAKEVTAVPSEAIVVKDLTSYIFVTENDTAKRIKVERGIIDGELQEVFGDIEEGMDLVVEGQFLLDNNDKVEIVQ